MFPNKSLDTINCIAIIIWLFLFIQIDRQTPYPILCAEDIPLLKIKKP